MKDKLLVFMLKIFVISFLFFFLKCFDWFFLLLFFLYFKYNIGMKNLSI